MDIEEIKRLMRWSDKQRPEIMALLVKAEQAEQGWATASAACNRVAGERDRLTSELTSAKEEIERLKEQSEKYRLEMIRCGKGWEAAESSLSSERKETERLRFATSEVSTHLGAIEAIIKTCIELKPSKCILTDKYDGICPHCESDISWLHHELKAHGEYSKAIAEALHPPQQEEQ